jgi:hypothetical protein
MKGTQMKFTDMFPSRFWKADDVTQPLIVKIRDVTMETLGGEGGDVKPVVYFTGQEKALALNKTNAERIITIAGSDDSEAWVGVGMELYRDTVLFRGQRTPCVRIRKPRNKPAVSPQSVRSDEAPWPEEDIPDSWESDVR